MKKSILALSALLATCAITVGFITNRYNNDQKELVKEYEQIYSFSLNSDCISLPNSLESLDFGINSVSSKKEIRKILISHKKAVKRFRKNNLGKLCKIHYEKHKSLLAKYRLMNAK